MDPTFLEVFIWSIFSIDVNVSILHCNTLRAVVSPGRTLRSVRSVRPGETTARRVAL